MQMIAVQKELHTRIRILSNDTGKKIYALIEEAIRDLEKKYKSNETK